MNTTRLHVLPDQDAPVTDAELAAAAARLQSLPPEAIEPLSPEWIEGAVANAVASTAPVGLGARLRWLPRWLAAAAALLGIQGSVAAMTVAAVGVSAAAVTAVVLVWQAGHNSNETMPFPMAVEILLREDQPDADRASALSQVFRRARAVATAMRAIRTEGGDAALVAAADAGLTAIHAAVGGGTSSTKIAVDESFESSFLVLRDRAQEPAVRQLHLSRCLSMVETGLAAIHAIPGCSSGLAADREVLLGHLRDATSR